MSITTSKPAAVAQPSSDSTSNSSSKKGGPRTAEGKARSALNNLRHGLTGWFHVRGNESQADFDALVAALREEYQPATATEEILVQKIAEHCWLGRRAISYSDNAMDHNCPDYVALMIRYQTMHDRQYHKCSAELRALQKGRRDEQTNKKQEFESQLAAAIAEFESQEDETPAQASHKAMIQSVRTAMRGLCPASDDDVLTIFSQSLVHAFQTLVPGLKKPEEKAAA